MWNKTISFTSCTRRFNNQGGERGERGERGVEEVEEVEAGAEKPGAAGKVGEGDEESVKEGKVEGEEGGEEKGEAEGGEDFTPLCLANNVCANNVCANNEIPCPTDTISLAALISACAKARTFLPTSPDTNTCAVFSIACVAARNSAVRSDKANSNLKRVRGLLAL